MKTLKIPKYEDCTHNEYGQNGSEPITCYRCYRPLKFVKKVISRTVWDPIVDTELEKKLKRKKK